MTSWWIAWPDRHPSKGRDHLKRWSVLESAPTARPGVFAEIAKHFRTEEAARVASAGPDLLAAARLVMAEAQTRTPATEALAAAIAKAEFRTNE